MNPTLGDGGQNSEDLGSPRDGLTTKEMFEQAYATLREIAAMRLARERSNHTLQPTALVHEAYLKLVSQSKSEFKNETHFLAIAAIAMRRILVDSARRLASHGGSNRVTIDTEPLQDDRQDGVFEVLSVDDALRRLGTHHPRQERVVEMRYFGGMTIRQVAEELGISHSTVDEDWSFAKAFLRRELAED